MSQRAYYNEWNKDAAAWLRELIAAKLIMVGDVDERSIVDVRSIDLKGYAQHHFFAGIGGWSLALQLAGWPDDRPVCTASLPCQPFSNAGKRQGVKDERHLWPVFAELVRECGFATIFGEQVESAIRHGWLDGVFSSLEQFGYACAAGCLPAACVGAPHIRQRVYWVANAERDGGRFDEPGRRPQERTADGRTGGLADAERAYSGGGIAGEQGQSGCGRAGLADDGELGRLGNAPAGGRGIGGDATQPGSGGHALGTGGAGLGGMGNTGGAGREGHRPELPQRGGEQLPAEPSCRPWSDFILIPCRDGKARRTKSGLSPLAYGLPRDVADLLPRLEKLGHDPKAARRIIREARRHRVVALKGAGNSIVPPLAAEFIRAAMEAVAGPLFEGNKTCGICHLV